MESIIELENTVEFQVTLAKNGDKEAFARVIRQHKESMYRVAKSILKIEEDVEDAVSEAILKAYTSIRNLKHSSMFKTWVIRIVINESNNLLKKRRKLISLDKIFMDNEGKEDTHKDISLYEAINSLEEELRVTTILFYFDDMSYRDIASILDIKEGTVKSRLNRARKKLYMLLKEE
ncbi:sigma-70 family RNA polymerase sigma factor [Clostridium sp.]|uniref:sigma-70 family RNA polymerase sigma factor n=1 Tax=Clostridium sp. TaxID=1506 RepID=UPI003464D4BA